VAVQLQTEPAPRGEVDAALRALMDEMAALRAHVVREGARYLERTAPEAATGQAAAAAHNLAHYLALRQHDLRPLQERLARVGLSSLGRCEGQVLYTIDRVGELLGRATVRPWDTSAPEAASAPDFGAGTAAVEGAANVLFGPPAPDRAVRIMVTLPGAAADDYALVRSLVDAGMTCARINCAHDGPEVWRRAVANVRRAEAEAGRTCRIQMDLAGHKVRTTTLTARGAPVRLHVAHPKAGGRRTPAEVLLWDGKGASPAPPGPALPVLVLDPKTVADLRRGDRLHLTDLRGKARTLAVREPVGDGAWRAHTRRTAEVGPGTRLRRAARRGADAPRRRTAPRVLDTFAAPDEVRLGTGATFRLGAGAPQAVPPGSAPDAAPVVEIGCTDPGVIGALRAGDPVWIDDGKLGAVVERADGAGAWLKVVHARPQGTRVRPDKGLNFPDTPLKRPALTDKDLADLAFVCGHADVVGFSFVESGEDMVALSKALAEHGRPGMPIVAKIETAKGVSAVPGILLATMGRHPVGVMIARGDLAVELGNVRMAEIQEELLWLCEAAHVPLVWATQVLETMAKKGIGSRPELTDAAMGVRAECVMLNKGPFVTLAVNTLDRILSRMQDHQRKKTSRLRALTCWKL
jgi:pyruvate kinase